MATLIGAYLTRNENCRNRIKITACDSRNEIRGPRTACGDGNPRGVGQPSLGLGSERGRLFMMDADNLRRMQCVNSVSEVRDHAPDHEVDALDMLRGEFFGECLYDRWRHHFPPPGSGPYFPGIVRGFPAACSLALRTDVHGADGPAGPAGFKWVPCLVGAAARAARFPGAFYPWFQARRRNRIPRQAPRPDHKDKTSLRCPQASPSADRQRTSGRRPASRNRRRCSSPHPGPTRGKVPRR